MGSNKLFSSCVSWGQIRLVIVGSLTKYPTAKGHEDQYNSISL